MLLTLPRGLVLAGTCALISFAVACGGAQNQASPAGGTSASSGSTALSGAAPRSTSVLLTANPAALNFGSVQVGASATQSPVVSNTGTADANITSLTTSDPAFRVTAPAVPLTLSAGYSVTSQVQFVPWGAGNFNATLVVASAEVPTLTVALAGTGVFAPTPAPTPIPGQLMATLAWGASSSIVEGYNVYRGAASGGPYTRINTAVVTALTFGDTTVAAGQTYYYVVTATAAGVESTYSNEVQAIIPLP